VVKYLKEPVERFVKTLLYVADGKPVIALVRGDRALNELKLKAAVGATALELASDSLVTEITGAPVGYAGAHGRPQELGTPTYADPEVAAIASAITGANKGDYHVRGWSLGRDVPKAKIVDLRTAAEGDRCARCEGGTYKAFRGIEVGHVFYLGTKYSASMKCHFLDAEGKERPMPMGCYGIGVTRVAAAAIEQNHDGDGIIWPVPIAPFHVEIVPAGKEPEVVEVAEKLEAALEAAKLDVLLDDRDERPGVKFKDADLLGVPFRVTVGKKGLAEGIVELKERRGGEVKKVPIADAAKAVIEAVQAALAKYQA
jgi:prolyl-tRNA synthetase